MNLLITTNDHHTLFETKDNTFKKLEFRDFSYHDLAYPSNETFNFPLVFPLVEQIIENLFYTYIVNRNFNLAFQLTTLSPYFMELFFKKLFYQFPRSKKLIKRLSRVFLIMETIDDTLTSIDDSYSIPVCFELKTIYNHNGMLKIWNFGNEIKLRSMYSVLDYHSFTVGSMYHHRVWAVGEWDEGLFKAEKVYNPVIYISLIDTHKSLLVNQKTHLNNLRKFSKIFKIAYGENVGVFLMINPLDEHNPFIRQSEHCVLI